MKIVAHRGASVAAPENTMAAFREALVGRADGIELDVQTSADGELVVIHDMTLDRTTSGQGNVFGHPWSTLRDLDAGSWFSDRYSDERIPRLQDVLALDDLEFEIELKGYGERFLADVLRIVRDAKVLPRVEFTSWNVPLLLQLKAVEPSARIGLFASSKPPWMDDGAYEYQTIGLASTSGFDVIHVSASSVTRSIVERLHECGMDVHANDANTPDDVRCARHAGADSLSTDDISIAR